jgi:hypothetical protein
MSPIEEDVMRELMRDATSDLFASPAATAGAIRYQRRRQFRTRMIGAGATAAVAGLAVGVIVTTSGGGSPPAVGAPVTIPAKLTAAQQTLYSLSSAAAGTHRPSGRYVVMTEKSISDGDVGAKTSVIDTVTGGGLTYQRITVPGEPGGPPSVLKAGPGTSPTQAQLDAMPTSVPGLRAVLLAQAKREQAQANAMTREKAREVEKKTGQKSTVTSPQPTDSDFVFEEATIYLWTPNLSPALRSALYKVLASTPGVVVNPHAHDSAGRPAIEISRTDTFGQANVMTFENAKTGTTLETASQLPDEGLNEDLYLSISYSNSIPANPYQH